MPTPTKGPRLGGGPAHERLMLANLASSLIIHKRITTTEAKAKRLRPYAERLVTLAKRGDLHARRRAMATLRHKNSKGYITYRGTGMQEVNVIDLLFTEIGPAMAERPGGYTRITKAGPRKGDAAPMAIIEFVMEPMSAKRATVAEAEGALKRSVKEAEMAAEEKADEASATEAVEDAATDAATEATEEATDAVEDAADAAEEVADEATDAVEEATDAAEDAASDAAEEATDVAEEAAEEVSDAAESAEDAAEEAASDAQEAVEEAGDAEGEEKA